MAENISDITPAEPPGQLAQMAAIRHIVAQMAHTQQDGVAPRQGDEPNQIVAELSDKGRLEMTLTIGRGRGYVPADMNRGPEHTIGVIPDALVAMEVADHDSDELVVTLRAAR